MFSILMIALCVVVTTVITSRLSLPDIQGIRAESGEKLNVGSGFSII